MPDHQPCTCRNVLPEGSPEVAEELLDRVGRPFQADERSWIPEHQKMYETLRQPWGVPPPCKATGASPWFGTLTACQQSSLTLHQCQMLQSEPRGVGKAFGQGSSASGHSTSAGTAFGQVSSPAGHMRGRPLARFLQPPVLLQCRSFWSTLTQVLADSQPASWMRCKGRLLNAFCPSKLYGSTSHIPGPLGSCWGGKQCYSRDILYPRCQTHR